MVCVRLKYSGSKPPDFQYQLFAVRAETTDSDPIRFTQRSCPPTGATNRIIKIYHVSTPGTTATRIKNYSRHSRLRNRLLSKGHPFHAPAWMTALPGIEPGSSGIFGQSIGRLSVTGLILRMGWMKSPPVSKPDVLPLHHKAMLFSHESPGVLCLFG